MVLSRLTRITGPGVSTDTNWVGNNANFTGVTTSGSSFNIGVTTIHSNLIEAHNIVSTGVVTAISFSGDGSGLTGVANTDFVVGTAITMGTANFTGNVTIGGTLTYEDVTNIDSVGIITAQKGIHVGAGVSAVGVGTFGSLDIGGDIDVDGHTNLDDVSVAGIITSSSDIDLISNDAQLLLEYPGRTRGHITANYYNRIAVSSNKPATDITFGYTDYPGNSASFSNPPKTVVIVDNGEPSLKVNKPGVGFGVTLSGTGNAAFTGIVTATNIITHSNVGIASASPTHTLEVGGSVKANAQIKGYSGNHAVPSFTFSSAASTGMYLLNSNGTIGFSNAGTHTATLDNNGKLSLLRDLDVDGHTNLDNVSIAGVTTCGRIDTDTINVSANSDIRFASGSWSGNTTKIQNHNSYLYLVAPSNGFQFRIGATDLWLMDSLSNDGNFWPTVDSGRDIGKSNRRVRNLYATTLYGDGSNLTGITGTTINNNADNRIITGSGTANTLNGESGLTFNGTDLVMNTSGGRIFCTRTTGEAALLLGSSNAGGATLYLDGDSNGDWSGGDYAYIRHNTNGHLHIVADNPAAQGAIDFFTGNTTYHGTITSDGILSMNGASNSRAIEINPGGNAGTIVLDRNGYITSMIRASDGGSNVGGGSGGGSRLHLAKNAMNFQTFPYVSNVGDAVTYTTRCSIDTSGHFVPGADNTYDLGTSSLRWRDIYTGDLHLSNETKGANNVDGTWGDWTLQEGESDVFMINNRSGKKFKIKMEEVD